MWVRLTRRLADCIDGVNLSAHQVGDVFEVTRHEAELLVAEAWAVLSTSAERPFRSRRPVRSNGANVDRRQLGPLAERLRTHHEAHQPPDQSSTRMVVAPKIAFVTNGTTRTQKSSTMATTRCRAEPLPLRTRALVASRCFLRTPRWVTTCRTVRDHRRVEFERPIGGLPVAGRDQVEQKPSDDREAEPGPGASFLVRARRPLALTRRRVSARPAPGRGDRTAARPARRARSTRRRAVRSATATERTYAASSRESPPPRRRAVRRAARSDRVRPLRRPPSAARRASRNGESTCGGWFRPAPPGRAAIAGRAPLGGRLDDAAEQVVAALGHRACARLRLWTPRRPVRCVASVRPLRWRGSAASASATRTRAAVRSDPTR